MKDARARSKSSTMDSSLYEFDLFAVTLHAQFFINKNKVKIAEKIKVVYKKNK